MLYTAKVSDLEKNKRKMKIYYLIPNYGNEEVIPDKSDIENYQSGTITWEGFKLNYSQILMRDESMEWMLKVASEAVSADVVIADEGEDAEHSTRILLADRIKNMFIGRINLKYAGEIAK